MEICRCGLSTVARLIEGSIGRILPRVEGFHPQNWLWNFFHTSYAASVSLARRRSANMDLSEAFAKFWDDAAFLYARNDGSMFARIHLEPHTEHLSPGTSSGSSLGLESKSRSFFMPVTLLAPPKITDVCRYLSRRANLSISSTVWLAARTNADPVARQPATR